MNFDIYQSHYFAILIMLVKLLNFYCDFRLLNTLDNPLIHAKWINVKKAISEETEVVRQLDVEEMEVVALF